jgi:hypothetical protein
LKSKQFYCLCSGAKAARGVNLPGESRSSARHWNADMAIEIVNSELRKSTGDEENSSPPVLILWGFFSQAALRDQGIIYKPVVGI